MTDGELVGQILTGRTWAYGPLAQRYGARVLAVCHARVGREAAEDLAQESLLRALRSLPMLQDREKFGSWLMGIAVRTCLDWLKSAKRSEVSLEAIDGAGGGCLADVPSLEAAYCDHRERSERLMLEVERLPAPCREAILHYYYGQYSYQEIADLLGVSSATVNARLTKARALLRERMMAERE
jgi:RNA polymerase sigma-70 factor (ECF subfamily)